MAKKQTRQFSYTPTHKLPKLGNVKTEWDLQNLYYKSLNDSRIEADVSAAERSYNQFAKKYRNLAFLKSDKALIVSLEAYKKLHDTHLEKPLVYLFLRREIDATDTKAEQLINQLEQRITKFSNEILFYTLALGKLSKKRQVALLSNAKISEFHFFLEGIFQNAKYTLTEAEEKILNLKSMTSRGLWIAGTEKIIGNTSISVGNKEIPLNEALMKLQDTPAKERAKIWQGCVKTLRELGPVAENELTAILLDKKINDELRGYQKPYSATVLAFDTTEKSLETLVDVVTTEGYRVAKKFYKLKSKLYGRKLPYLERDDFQNRLPTVDFTQAVKICRDGFYNFNPLYGKIFDEMLTSGQIDVYPRKGKGGGAFCLSTTNVPTVVMLNHSSDFSSVRTLAHEMGHAIHAYRSKTQGVLYQDHSTVTAETASTFFEAVVGKVLLDQLPDAQKAIYLNALISDKIGTMIMCIARYNAELEIHETVRKRGSMTWQEMSAVLAKHFRQYCGASVDIADEDGLILLAKTHYRRNFYQFTYSFGAIASNAMFQKYQADTAYSQKVDTFLSAGEKNNVEKIFREIGIDTTKKETFLAGIRQLEAEINEFEKLVKTKKT